MNGLEEIEKYQHDEYMRKHRGTPGCGAVLLLVALFTLVLML